MRMSPWIGLAVLMVVGGSGVAAGQDLSAVPPAELALQAAPVISPPGPEYAGAARAFQGIPGVERAPNGRRNHDE
jgi:hypothetical protein